MLERCPYCNSTDLIWDYERGYLVCTSCGSVISQLFADLFMPYPQSNAYTEPQGMYSIRESLREKDRRIYARKLSKISKEVYLYEKYSKKARKNVEVNIRALLEGTKEKIYRHRNDSMLTRLMEDDSELKRIIKEIVEKDPVFSSRTYRGKVAIAMMLKYLVRGEEPNLEEIVKKTSISRTHAKRLYNLVLTRLGNILARA